MKIILLFSRLTTSTEGEGLQSRQGLRTMSHSSNRSTTATSGRSSIRTRLYPNFHSNTRLAQTQIYFELSGTSHIVHSLDVEMYSVNWNLHGHSLDVLYPSGLLGGTCIAIDLLTYEAVWSG